MVEDSQLELNYRAPVDPSATATVEEVERLVGILTEHGMLTAAQICLKFGLQPTDNNKRKVRAIAKAARPGIISFPSSGGYKLAAACTLDEINAAISAWDSIIRDATITKKLFLDLYYSRGGGVR